MTVPTSSLEQQVSAWIDENWDPALTLAAWWQRLARSGYASPGLSPDAGGLGLDPHGVTVVRRALAERGCMGPPGGIGTMLAAPTIAVHGTSDQIARYVEPILAGRVAWCQLFSEPDAGSDLANVRCRAVRDGDDWIVTGQKVWTSGGQFADMGMLLARTNPDDQGRGGLSWFAFPMRQPGVSVRPLREMTGEAVFNEVFLDEARVSNQALVGRLNGGWQVAGTTLTVERSSLGSARVDLPAESPGKAAGRLDRVVGDLLRSSEHGEDFLAGTHLGDDDLDRWIELARHHARAHDPTVRQALAGLAVLVRINQMTAERTAAGSVAGADNLAKLAMSELFRRFRDAGNLIVGAHGMLTGPGRHHGWTVPDLTQFSPAPAIYGGTDQIQRNIVAERVLGLPREPR